jgi:tetratricopeptide (TPR) repeat protein
MRYLVLALAAISLVSCSRDPNVLKARYLESGNKYFDAGRFKEASIMYRKSIEADRKYGPAYYHLALTDLKLGSVAGAVPMFRRAHELLKAGTPEADDTDLKLSEILIVASQGQEHNEAVIKDVQLMVDGLLKRNPNGWEGHKLSGDLDMVQTAKLYRAQDGIAAKRTLGDAISEYRKALSMKPGDPVVSLALSRTLVVDGETAEAETILKGLIDKDKTSQNPYYELYRVYLAERKIPEAEALLKSGIQNNPKNTQMRLTLAQFYFGTNKRDQLLELLNQMKGDLKQFPNAYIEAGDFYARVNSFDDAIKQYEEGIQKDPARKNTYLKLEIQVYVRQGKSDLAFKVNEQVLKNDPKDPDARGLKATFLLDKGDVNTAMADLQSVVTAKPNNFVARFNLGRAHFARQEYEQARQEFDAAIGLRPDYIPARLAQTQVALVRQDFDAALIDADAVLKISPNSVQGTVMKAEALQRLHRSDEARGLLTKVLEKNPKQVESLLELGLLDLNEKKVKDGEDLFKRAWEADPNNLRGLMGESRAYLMDGQPDKSVQVVEAEAQKYPKRLDLQSLLGNSEVSSGQVDKAIGTFQSLMPKVSDPRQQSDLWNRIGEAWLRKGDYQQSINSIEKARQGQPQNVNLMIELAMLYEAQNKKDVSRKYYEQSLKIDPTNALALNNLAYLIAETTGGDLDQALTYATKAKQRLPNHPEINDTLGWIYLKKNLTDNAVDTFRTLVTQAPQSSTYHYHYAMALMQKGDLVTAKKECESALADKPKKEEENQIHQLMTKLG